MKAIAKTGAAPDRAVPAPERSGAAEQKLASSKPSPLLVLLVRSPDFLVRTPPAYRRQVGVATSALIVLLLGAADFLSPRDITYSILYLFPISFSAWALGKRPGLLIAMLATVSWLTAEAHGRPELKGWILFWNAISRFGVFAFIVLLIAELRVFTDHLAELVDDRTRRLETETAQRVAIEREIAAISDREQKRISHELHDGLGQHLAGLAFRSKALEQRLAARQVPETADATELTLLIRSAVAQVRVLARGLDPIEIEGGDLIAALQSLARETQRTFQIPCEFQPPPTAGLRLDRHIGLALYRITQEAIHNALEHGHAKNLQIDLNVNERQARIHIKDNGQGFIPKENDRSGMGLRIMRFRATSLGGTLEISSSAAGTTVVCSLPIPQKPAS